MYVRIGFFVIPLMVVLAGAVNLSSMDSLSRQDPNSLQQKTIKAIESLSHVLIDLKASLIKEGNAAVPTESPLMTENYTDVGILESLLSNLTTALKNHTMALLESKVQHTTLTGCPVPYWRMDDECFYVNQNLRVSWSEARHFCQGIGGDLAQPRQVAILRAALLMKFPEYHSKFFWVGASEAGGTEGNWKWMSGAGVRTEEWALDQPDGGNENCVVLSRDEHPSLHDSPCYTHTTFICQAKIPSPVPALS